MTLVDQLIGRGDPVALSSARVEKKCWENEVANLAEEILVIRNQPSNAMKAHERNARVVEKVKIDFRRRGEIYHDGSAGYVFLRDARVLLRLELGQEPLEVALAMYGLAPTEQITKQVVEMLRLYARANGKKTSVYELSHHDRANNVLHVFDFDCGIYQIDEIGVRHVDNGTDGVLFLQSPSRAPYSLDGQIVHADGKWRNWIADGVRFAPGHVDAEQQQALIVLWVIALFFRLPTKVILAAIGEKGSGKSSLLRKTGKWLFGEAFDVTPLASKPDEFDVAVTNDPLVVADNVDDAPAWFNDKLAVMATGGKLKKRILYSNNRMGEYPFKASLAVTSRTPKFTRDDVADRTIPIHLERLDGFVDESELLADVKHNRHAMLASLLGDLHRVVCALGQTRGRQYRTTLRMADFAVLVSRIADANGELANASFLLRALAGEQAEFANGTEDEKDDPLYPLLDEWLRMEDPVVNLNREVPTATLAEELKQVAARQRVRWPCRNGQALGQYLRHRRGLLELWYGASSCTGHAGERFWTFTRVNGDKGESNHG
jgi:hypothetical protein